MVLNTVNPGAKTRSSDRHELASARGGNTRTLCGFFSVWCSRRVWREKEEKRKKRDEGLWVRKRGRSGQWRAFSRMLAGARSRQPAPACTDLVQLSTRYKRQTEKFRGEDYLEEWSRGPKTKPGKVLCFCTVFPQSVYVLYLYIQCTRALKPSQTGAKTSMRAV